MARPKKVVWNRPDIERLRDAEVQRSPVQDEVVIPAALRDQIVGYIAELENLIDARLGPMARQNPQLTPLQLLALEYEIDSGIPTKPAMFSGISARDLADKMAEGEHFHPDGREINEDAIDAWRKYPPYREYYIRGFLTRVWPAAESH